MEKLKNINWYYVIVILVICVVLYLIISNTVGSNLMQNIYPTNAPSHPESFESAATNPVQLEKGTVINDPYDAEIVLYYATWCGYSRMFLPEWDKFVEYAKANLSNVKVTGIRCEDGNEAVCLQKGVQGYPTIILYPKHDTEINYGGERKAEKLIEFVNKNVKK